jgi:hypothetical protein
MILLIWIEILNFGDQVSFIYSSNHQPVVEQYNPFMRGEAYDYKSTALDTVVRPGHLEWTENLLL